MSPCPVVKPVPLHFVWQYTQYDHDFWLRHFEDWIPKVLFDAHTHVCDPALRTFPVTETQRRQFWVTEVNEPITAEDTRRCHELVFPGRDVSCLCFGHPNLDFDIDGVNAYIATECQRRNWYGLALLRPEWSQQKIEALLDTPRIIGLKPYYALIGANRETRDQYLEADLFEFLPHHALEVLNARKKWVTLHVSKARRLGDPDNLRAIRELRNRYPDIVLVIAHLGRCYCEAHAREGLIPLADDPGILFDTSAVLNPDSFRIALEYIGPNRLIYGTDNPVFYMRGRRQFHETTYVNRTNVDFYFNKERESPEIEANYTLTMYEDLLAIKQACTELGMLDPEIAKRIFYENAMEQIGVSV